MRRALDAALRNFAEDNALSTLHFVGL